MTRDIIVIGASAGGVNVLKKLAGGLPIDLPASVFVNLHILAREDDILPQILNASGPLRATYPRDGEGIKLGHIYVAPPDHHVVFSGDRVHLSHGPKENMQRPCINVMFRSAAAAFGSRVIGVVLSGMLDDGAAGLWEIKRKGGLAVVQEPSEAAYRSMPESAIGGLDVDHVVRVAEMATLLTGLTGTGREGGGKVVPDEEKIEPATQGCPACGGVMHRATIGRMHEYRCHTGHRFGIRTMLQEKTVAQERALYAALAQAEELTALMQEARSDAAAVERQRRRAEALRAMLHSGD